MDVILKLLEKDKSKRLGSKNGASEIFQHPFFADVDVDALEQKKIKPPFMPNFGKKDLTEFFNVQSKEQEIADTYIPRGNR